MPDPFPSSLCHRCAHNRYIATARGPRYLRCAALPQKYQPQPVLRCPAFTLRPKEPL